MQPLSEIRNGRATVWRHLLMCGLTIFIRRKVSGNIPDHARKRLIYLSYGAAPYHGLNRRARRCSATSRHAPMRVLPHITKLDDALGDFLVRVTCPCGTSRHIEPETLARIAGRSVTLAKLATRMRCSQCGKKVAEVVAVARPRPRGGGRREG